ncbi:carboxypeptidase regulatory-like domain-containing protein [Tolypothrix sp. FACHB-123]|uniref:carboxypeptidase regulatory-like domain-containing protein n=1 Tax=Tolypothrix sp. FACHB-123 TaxID=2692868 RepID=UPI001681DDF7|nr:carboxypeptidase regulatory-like domain-containing protein [Tolypothrix sp. FACHB-123]MBD2358717.1 carboxypeptidase regulatory-like domain-containing protein [Tolypothrix sp. FACHB-123]
MTNSVSEEIIYIKHRAAIAGYVTDAITGKGISGVAVKVVGKNLSTLTNKDGFFYFVDLEKGQYDLNILVSKESHRIYGGSDDEPTTTIQGIAVESDGKPVFDLKANVALYPTRLVGSVKRSDNQNNVPKAIIKLRGSEIQTLTDDKGQYFLSGLRSPVTIQVSATEIATTSQQVTLEPGKQQSLDFNVKPTPILKGQVTRSDPKDPIKNAIVNIWYNNELEASTETNENGNYTLSGLPEGNVTVQVSAMGFATTKLERVTLTAGSDTKQDFSF